ncbi:MAG TPA: DUF2127 domain-containing protein [Verrucomicrobiae bacterium]|jgi:uncharacterized membrane protein (DUF2068 family)|nr:DUF2127 domain-containing protein [Verrucomicrobiae bacterium]
MDLRRLYNTDLKHHAGLRVVALFEGFKGLLVLIVGLTLLHYVDEGVQRAAEEIVRHLHLNPASRIPRIFEAAAGRVPDAQIEGLALGAFLYSIMRFVECYGLWRNRVWAEWFALVSSGVFVPVEIYEMVVKPTPVKATLLVLNVAVVIYLAFCLRSNRSEAIAANAGAAL